MRGSKPGERRGGRARGTPNKRTLFLEERLEELNCDPIGYMAKVMMDEEAHPQVRFSAAKELAQYIAAKRKAIEVTGDPDLIDRPLIEVRWIESIDGPPVNGHTNGGGQLPPAPSSR